VARHPAWIEKVFCGATTVDRNGSYEVRLYHPGKRGFVHVKVDDFVPEDTGRPAFSRPTFRGELWPCLLEKAFAKLCGGYSETEGGNAAWGMKYICGEGAEMWRRQDTDSGKWVREKLVWRGDASETVNRCSKEKEVECFEVQPDPKTGATEIESSRVWDALQAYGIKKYAMCASILAGTEEKKGGSMKGLLAGQAYSLITAKRITNEGRELKLVRLRYPQGVGEWRGPWGGRSKRWSEHPKVGENLEGVEKDDGCFWMCFKDFMTYFDTFSVMKKDLC